MCKFLRSFIILFTLHVFINCNCYCQNENYDSIPFDPAIKYSKYANINTDSIICVKENDSLPGKGVFIIVDSMPEFPGGTSSLLKFFMDKFKYPKGIYACCKEVVEFIIDPSGNAINLKILSGLQNDIDKETIRVLSLMPKWKPGKCQGLIVPVKMTISFRLEIQ